VQLNFSTEKEARPKGAGASRGGCPPH
jgi:hypothetical protein